MELAFDTHESMIKAIIKSQHTQRNWDLSREIPADDMKVLEAAVTQCPSKQNFAFYKTTFVTNRSVIEKIHEQTLGLGYIDAETKQRVECTNPQALANLLVIFEEITPSENFNKHHRLRNENKKSIFERDRDTALGIAVGYMNVVATMLGYETGCCACYNGKAIQELLGLENEVVLMMGVGYKNPNLNRRIHHANHTFMFPTKPKQEISVSWHK